MATTNTWDQVVSKITGVVNRGAFSKTYTPSTSRQTKNGSAGYYSSITTVCNAVSLSGNASKSQVLTGRTFYTTSLTRQTGTMVNRGAVRQTINPGGSYTIPAGYHNGSGKVTANKLGTAWQTMTLVSHDYSGDPNSYVYTASSTGYYLFIVSMRAYYADSFPVNGSFNTNGTTIYCYTCNGGSGAYNYGSVAYVYLTSNQWVRYDESGDYDYRSCGYQVFRIT